MSTSEAEEIDTDKSRQVTPEEKMTPAFPSRLMSFIYHLDAEFPLSGGETNEELEKNIHYIEDEGSTFVHSGDGTFPLTGE